MTTTHEPAQVGAVAQALVSRAREVQARLTGGPGLAQTDEAVAAEESRREPRARRVETFVEHCPRRFATATLDDAEPEQQATLTAWADGHDGRNLLLAGNVGSGKSHLAMATLRHLVTETGRHVGFRIETAVSLLDSLRPGHVEPAPDGASPWWSPPDPMRRACNIEVLVVDDIGVERPTEWVSERLSEIIDARWRQKLPTIATTNLTLGPTGQLIEAVGERAYSRLVGSDAVVIRLAGKDRRRS